VPQKERLILAQTATLGAGMREIKSQFLDVVEEKSEEW